MTLPRSLAAAQASVTPIIDLPGPRRLTCKTEFQAFLVVHSFIFGQSENVSRWFGCPQNFEKLVIVVSQIDNRRVTSLFIISRAIEVKIVRGRFQENVVGVELLVFDRGFLAIRLVDRKMRLLAECSTVPWVIYISHCKSEIVSGWISS
jgi:hypothetical protein